jgi:hypothetical protein
LAGRGAAIFIYQVAIVALFGGVEEGVATCSQTATFFKAEEGGVGGFIGEVVVVGSVDEFG